MGLEDKVLNKVGEKVSKELDKALNKEETLEGYTRRTMHGKLAKKLAKKSIKKEKGEDYDYPEDNITDDDLHNKVVGRPKNKEEDKGKKIDNILFLIGLVVFIIGMVSVILGSYPVLIVSTILVVGVLVAMLVMGRKTRNTTGNNVLAPEDKELLNFNRVFKYTENDKYYRHYELMGIPNLEEYRAQKKLIGINFNALEGKEIAPILTNQELLKFKEMNNLNTNPQDKVEQDKVEQDKVEQDKVEQDKVEQDKVEQDKVEQDKVEQDKVEQDKEVEQTKEQDTTGNNVGVQEVLTQTETEGKITTTLDVKGTDDEEDVRVEAEVEVIKESEIKESDTEETKEEVSKTIKDNESVEEVPDKKEDKTL